MSADKLDRIVCFVDGFNLFHAIRDLKQDHLKWVDLWKLMSLFVDRSRQEIIQVFYFTALANWRADAPKRHQTYIKALESAGVTTVKGKFKAKHRYCPNCKASPLAHEEKESDVNIALYMLDCAYQDTFDCAFLLSGDSDLVPAVRLVRKRFPEKTIKLIGPPERSLSKELRDATNVTAGKIKKIHLDKSLLPGKLTDGKGERNHPSTEVRPAGNKLNKSCQARFGASACPPPDVERRRRDVMHIAKRISIAICLFSIAASLASGLSACGSITFDDDEPVYGSCRNTMGDDTTCFEYMQDMQGMAAGDCASAGGAYVEDPCPTENRIARCTYVLNGVTKRWTYYEGFALSRGDIELTCSLAGGDFD